MRAKHLLLFFSLFFFALQVNSASEAGVSAEGFEDFTSGCHWDNRHYDEYEHGWGIWRDGGTDCYRHKSFLGGLFSWIFGKSNHSIRLRDNSGWGSSTYTHDLDFSNIVSTKLEFAYHATGFSHGEKFLLEYSLDGGKSWKFGQNWIRGTHFSLGKKHIVSSIINAKFSKLTRFRFRCDASSNYDKVHIDNVRIKTCKGTNSVCNDKSVNFVNKGSCDLEVWDGSRKLGIVKPSKTGLFFGKLGKIFKLKSALLGSNWSRDYKVIDKCDQWHDAHTSCEAACSAVVTGFKLDKRSSNSGTEVCTDTYKHHDIGVEALVSNHHRGSVKFEISTPLGNWSNVENLAPFDSKKFWATKIGHYSIKATVFSEDHARGSVCDTKTFTFQVKDCAPVCHEKDVHFVNKGSKDVEIWDGSRKIGFVGKGLTLKKRLLFGKLIKIKSLLGKGNWSKDYTVKNDCDQWVEFTPQGDDDNSGNAQCSWHDAHYSDYESGWDIWHDGGSDCYRYNSLLGSIFNWLKGKSNYSLRLRDNSGRYSSTFTRDLDFTHTESAKVDFAYHTENFSGQEDFFLEYSLDGGRSWKHGHKYVHNQHFVNKKKNIVSAIINAKFTKLTKFRFRCDASSNYDRLYIDNVKIKTCGGGYSGIQEEKTQSRSKSIEISNEASLDADITIFPNPAFNAVNFNMEGLVGTEDVQISVISMNGQAIHDTHHDVLETSKMRLDVSTYANGMYMLRIYSPNLEPINKKFVVSH